jgi:hypothetical protein
MATVEQNTKLGELLEPVCKPTRLKNKPARALRPFDPVDQKLLECPPGRYFQVALRSSLKTLQRWKEIEE